jgi:hypothetical protein
MICRKKDGTYVFSSAGGAWSRKASAKEGDDVLRRAIGKEEAERCIKENREVWVG